MINFQCICDKMAIVAKMHCCKTKVVCLIYNAQNLHNKGTNSSNWNISFGCILNTVPSVEFPPACKRDCGDCCETLGSSSNSGKHALQCPKQDAAASMTDHITLSSCHHFRGGTVSREDFFLKLSLSLLYNLHNVLFLLGYSNAYLLYMVLKN